MKITLKLIFTFLLLLTIALMPIGYASESTSSTEQAGKLGEFRPYKTDFEDTKIDEWSIISRNIIRQLVKIM